MKCLVQAALLHSQVFSICLILLETVSTGWRTCRVTHSAGQVSTAPKP